MGYSKFDGNEEDVMRVFLREETISRKELEGDYPHQINSLLRKKMIKRAGNDLLLTDRGRSAITQQLKNGEFWVAPLKQKSYDEIMGNKAKLKIPSEYKGYFK